MPEDKSKMPYFWICLGLVVGLAAGCLTYLFWLRPGMLRARQAQQSAREGQTDLSALMGSLAHELKNPLSTITVSLKLLAEDFQQPANGRERHALVRLDVLREETRRLSSLLDDVLQFVRRVELQRHRCDLNQLLRDMINFYGPQAQDTKVTLRHQLCPEEMFCDIDADLLKQALLNIFINAQQAMPDGGELMIRTTLEQGSAIIDITDTGPGISDADRQQVFSLSFSTKKGGSGLGLPTAKRIVDAHNGSIDVQTTPGRRTNFRILLPLAD